MSVKNKVQNLLENNKGTFFSGQDIANNLYVSRNAVCKAVKSLQSDGYAISAITKKGYCMARDNDKISANSIENLLDENSKNFKITVLKTVTSTNNYLKELATNGAEEGTVVISEEQTAGKGRKGRSFYSPDSSGVYMSLLLKPNINAESAVLLTALTAVAVCEAIEKLSGEKAKIKWVNDIFIDKKKVCGILTEASFGMENYSLEYVIIGIGINVFLPENQLPEEIKGIVTSIFNDKKEDIRNAIIAEVLKNILFYYKKFENKVFIDEYRSRSLAIGRTVDVIEVAKQYPAKVLDVDDQCRLIIETEDGEQKTIFSGEISIKI